MLALDSRGGSTLAYADSQNSDDLSTRSDENFPYLLDYSAIFSNADVLNIGVSNSTKHSIFVPWGTGNLSLGQVNNEKNVAMLRIRGSTNQDQSAGFILKNIDFKGDHILLTTGSVTKSRDAQLSFTFTIKDGLRQYQLIFVHGPLNINGWKNTDYYQTISSNSSRLIDLKKLLSPYTQSFSLEKITINVQRNTTISADFRIDLDVVNSVSVNRGQLQHDRYIFHDLNTMRSVDLNFQTLSDSFDIIDNGWTITDKKLSMNNEGVTTVALSAKQISSGIPSNYLSNLDVGASLSNLGSKDWLFLVVVLMPCLIYPYKVFRR